MALDLTIAPATVILEYLIIIELVVSPRHRDIISNTREDCSEPRTPSWLLLSLAQEVIAQGHILLNCNEYPQWSSRMLDLSRRGGR